LDLLDTTRVVRFRLFREACSNYKGNYIKDLNKLGRDLKSTVIIDNSPTSYLFHPENAIPCETWFDDETDTELLQFIPFLKELSKADNVRTFLETRKKDGKIIFNS
jgi:RNA polymerase II subunit A small phosphatase-like protein